MSCSLFYTWTSLDIKSLKTMEATGTDCIDQRPGAFSSPKSCVRNMYLKEQQNYSIKVQATFSKASCC